MTGITIHIHEDDWGMRNLHPAAAWADVAADVAAARAAGERNRDPAGLGYTDMHLIEPPAIDFAGVGLRREAVVGVLGRLMPAVARFNATIGAAIGRAERDPYGSYNDAPCCFGFDAATFVKVELQGDLVTAVWYEARSTDAGRLAALRAAMTGLDALTPMVVADYWLDAAGRVADAAFLDRYFAALTA